MQGLMASGLLSDKLCMNELCDKIKNSKTQPATATQAASTTQTETATQTVTTTQATSIIQIIATDECDVTITTNKHGSLRLNRVCTNTNGDKVSLGKKTRVQQNLPM